MSEVVPDLLSRAKGKIKSARGSMGLDCTYRVWSPPSPSRQIDALNPPQGSRKRKKTLMRLGLLTEDSSYGYHKERSLKGRLESASCRHVSNREYLRLEEPTDPSPSVSQRLTLPPVYKCHRLLRRVYRVRNAPDAEAEIHRRLSMYRLRTDREFFELSLGQAIEIIASYLQESEQQDRWNGNILWFDKSKGFGFLTCPDQQDVFLHSSQLSKTDQLTATAGARVTFLLGRRPQGPCAIDVRVIPKRERQPTTV